MLNYDQNHSSLFYLEKTSNLQNNKKIFDTVVGENNTTYMFGENEIEGTLQVEGILIGL